MLILIILDGWGYREERDDNAIAQAQTPHWDHWWKTYPHTLLDASGHAVGLPDQQMGNSEVGHLTMGAGRHILQDLTRIDQALAEGTLAQTPAFTQAFADARANGKAVHILGLLSPGGIHSHQTHIFALLPLAQQFKVPCYVHAFLDGRDTPPRSAQSSLEKLQTLCDNTEYCHIASISGRYYAMDRDKRWERTAVAYDVITSGQSHYHAQNALHALQLAYERNETDEFVQPTAIYREQPHFIHDGDSVIFMNFRADRARQLSRALVQPQFKNFTPPSRPTLHHFVTLTQYATDIPADIAFPPQPLNDIFAKVLADHQLHQLRIAETEKYAHVTFFFNGGIEAPFPYEERLLIPSPKVATYDLQPAMSAPEITQQLVNAIETQREDVIICNYANADMVGHTGNFAATVTAIETLDTCLNQVVTAAQKIHADVIITADHGNAEMLYDVKTQQPHTAHTTELVPFLHIGRASQITQPQGTLADIAPTLLTLLNLPIPEAMTGHSLLTLLT